MWIGGGGEWLQRWGPAQTLAWGSSYYLPAILADPIARDLGISSNWFFAAFSGSLVISGLLGPRVGRQIDRVGGQQVLRISNLLLAGGLALRAVFTSLWMMSGARLLLGIGMGFGLYDAFGALGRIYGSDARSGITGITLRGLRQHGRLALKLPAARVTKPSSFSCSWILLPTY